MGAAQSSNAATAVSNVANFVSQSTTANTTQTQNLEQNVQFQDCTVDISKDININESAKFNVTNTQISEATQDANLLNNIQQQMLQNASSQVGFLGIGYADASNSASEFVNDTNQIVQDMNVSAGQGSFINQGFTCDRSYISAQNLNISLDSSTDFLSQQTLNQQQTAKIVNDISQTVKQKASATVQGISGLLLLLVLLIAVIVYCITKPLSSGGFKILIAAIVIFVMAIIITWMYLKSSPPFFAKPDQCLYNSNMGCSDSCINMENQELSLNKTPLRYIYGLIPGDTSQPGGNLLQMSVSAVNPGATGGGAGNNGGYTMATANSLANIIGKYSSLASTLGIDNIPNPLSNYTVDNPPNNMAYWAIPTEFMVGGQNSCTPQILQLAKGAPGIISNCVNSKDKSGTIVDPTTQGLQGTSDPTLGVANLNLVEWQTYLQNDDSKNTKAKFARFVLCDIIGNIDLNIYIQDDELVQYNDPNNNPVVGPAKNNTQYSYQYHPMDATISWRNGMISGGNLQGQIGVCNNKTYKFQSFMRKIGFYILGAILFLAFLYMFYTWYKNRKNKKASNTNSNTNSNENSNTNSNETLNTNSNEEEIPLVKKLPPALQPASSGASGASEEII